jgi:hypothetical protein
MAEDKYKGQKPIVHILFSGKKVLKSTIEYLVNAKKISKRAKYLCSFCIQFFECTFEAGVKRIKLDTSTVCGCIHHINVIKRDEYKGKEMKLTPICNSKSIPNKVLMNLRSENRLHENASHICSICIDYFRNGTPATLTVCELLENNTICKDDLNMLSFSYGQYISKNDSSVVNQKNFRGLKDLNVSECCNYFSDTLLSFSYGLCVCLKNSDTIDDLKKIIVLEQLLGLVLTPLKLEIIIIV